MQDSTPDFALRRTKMVDTQVRPSDVTRFPIIEAMLAVPREVFAPAARVEAAYVGENLPLAPGRVLLEPRTLAKMLDALDIRPGERVLDLAVGTGYSTALIARIAGGAVAVEPDPALAEAAHAALAAAGAEGAELIEGPAEAGAPGAGPFDAMILQCGVEIFPEALAGQLRDGGRVAALFVEGVLGVVRLGVRHQGRLHWRDIFNAGAPVLPGFAAARAFAL